MKTTKAALFAVTVLLGASIAADAFAYGRGGWRGGGHHHHGGWRVGVGVGVGVGYPGYWGGGWGYPYYSPYRHYAPYPYYAPYYPSYYPYSGAIYPNEPPAYVEQGQAQPSAPDRMPGGYWYYCRDSNGYYPNVEQCAGAWERVPPRPPS